jgi:hypothetical protein
MHDPYVKKDDQNLLKFRQESFFTGNLPEVLEDADYIFMCTAHKKYIEEADSILSSEKLKGVMDACNIYNSGIFKSKEKFYTGIGRGTGKPETEFVNFVYESFRAMEKGLANELMYLVDFYNQNYVHDDFNKVDFKEVQRLAKTCSTGCEIADPGVVDVVPEYKGFSCRLVQYAFKA